MCALQRDCLFDDPTVKALASKYKSSTAQICAVWTRQRGCTMSLGTGANSTTVAQYTKEVRILKDPKTHKKNKKKKMEGKNANRCVSVCLQDLNIFGFNMTKAEVDKLSALSPGRSQ